MKNSRHVGIVACSAEGAALCYRTICLEATNFMGEHNHPEITLDSIPMAQHMARVREGDWRGVADLMLKSAGRLKGAGAQFLICPDNTVHQAFEYLDQDSTLPWLHIAQVVAEEAKRRGFQRVGVMGTRYLMEGPVYPSALLSQGISYQLPDRTAREEIDRIIFKELVNAVFRPEALSFLLAQVEWFKERGCDAVVLGCTELPLIVLPEESVLPTLDSTRLLAKAALRKALEETVTA